MGYALQTETHKQTRLTHPPDFLGQLRGRERIKEFGANKTDTQLADRDSETLQGTQESPI